MASSALPSCLPTLLSSPSPSPSSSSHSTIIFNTRKPLPNPTSIALLFSRCRCPFRLLHDNRLSTIAKSQSNASPLVSPDDHWGVWAALMATGSFGLWSEKTKIGSMVSAALVSILVGLGASNLGIIPSNAPAYSTVFQYLLPLTIPLLLFKANLREVIQTTGTLLLAFSLGSVATIIGTTVAFLMVPMRSLGSNSWKIASAFMGSYIGGAINYIAVCEALQVSPSVIAAGVAADNVITVLYFIILFALASKIPAEAAKPNDADSSYLESNGSKLSVLQISTALAVSFIVCKAGSSFTKIFGIQGGILPVVTAITVFLATLLPSYFQPLAPAGDVFSIVLMQLFFAVLGASGSLRNIINTAPSIFLFAFVQVTVHLIVILCFGKFLKIDRKLILIASNANVGGPTTACAMATTKGWSSMVVPGILVGVFGISIATFLGIGFGNLVLSRM